MTAADLINLLSTGGSTVVLAVGIWAFLTGRIVPKSTHDAALADKDHQLAECGDREAELWEILKQVAGWTEQAAAVAERATRVAEHRITHSSPSHSHSRTPKPPPP